MRRIVLLLICCTFLSSVVSFASATCPQQSLADLSRADEFALDSGLPFRFPLDSMNDLTATAFAVFCTAANSMFGPPGKYHAAEDYHLPAGTPVYAMADGKVSFSGRMGGYGWLIIVDHPQANLYSLYGHLSPSRWHIRSGAQVVKGELIAYLGDSDENGGSAEHPMRPHLHFGVRAGQRSDYPGKGEWRWQAGWIKPCPAEVGWLQPSAIIISQEIPVGGFPQPSGEFFAKWGIELLLTGVYVLGGVFMLVLAIKKNKSILMVISGGLLFVAGWIFYSKGMKTGSVLLGMAILFSVLGIYKLIRSALRKVRA